MDRRQVASILFAICDISIGYLAFVLLPSIAIWIIALSTVGLLVIAIVLWLTGKQEREGVAKSVTPTSGEHVQRLFETDFFPKEGLRQRDIINFKVRYTGPFDHACLQAEVRLPNGTWISFPNYRTVSRHTNWFTRGKLEGFYDNEEWIWPGEIPETMPPREYSFRIRAYERDSYPFKVWFKLHVLSILKFQLSIGSINERILAINEWNPVQQGDHQVVISPQSDSPETRVRP